MQKGLVPLPGGGVAVYSSSGLLYYDHSDHLGSIRLGSTPSRTVLFDLAHAPFGETYATSGTTDPAFTSQRQDTSPSLYDFPDRQYGTQGRWPVPDPARLASMHLRDPQTLNRYAYVRNNPLVMIDPQGLDANDGNGPCGDAGADYGDCSPLAPDDCHDTACGTDPNNECGGDPTCGGPPDNSSTDCVSESADCQSITGDQSNSNPTTVETCISLVSPSSSELQGCSSSPFDNSLQGSLLAQMTPQDLQTFRSAGDWVTLGVAWDTLGISTVGAVLAAPAAPLVYTQVRATLIALKVGFSIYVAAEPGIVQFVNDVAIGYAKWEDAVPGYPSGAGQWIGFGAGAFGYWAELGFPIPNWPPWK